MTITHELPNFSADEPDAIVERVRLFLAPDGSVSPRDARKLFLHAAEAIATKLRAEAAAILSDLGDAPEPPKAKRQRAALDPLATRATPEQIDALVLSRLDATPRTSREIAESATMPERQVIEALGRMGATRTKAGRGHRYSLPVTPCP